MSDYIMKKPLDRLRVLALAEQQRQQIRRLGLEGYTHAFLVHEDSCAAHRGLTCNCEWTVILHPPADATP